MFQCVMIGFVGLGRMGVPMAKRLAEVPDTRILVYDRNPKQLSVLFQHLATPSPSYKTSAPRPEIIPCDSAFQVGYGASTVITMVDYTDNFHDLCVSGGGLFNGMYKRQLERAQQNLPLTKRASVLVNTGTVDFNVFRTLVHQSKEQFHLDMIDAPVSGTPTDASEGILSFMLGGTQDDPLVQERVLPVLQPLGRHFHYFRRRGDGLMAKLCNNMLMAATMVGVSEGMLLGVLLGIDKDALRRVFDASSARCWSNSHYNPYPGALPGSPASTGYRSGFPSEMMFRDLSLALNSAKQVNLDLCVTPAIHRIYQQLMRTQIRSFDFSSILPLLLDRKRSSRVHLKEDRIEFEEPTEPQVDARSQREARRRRKRERRRERNLQRFS